MNITRHIQRRLPNHPIRVIKTRLDGSERYIDLLHVETDSDIEAAAPMLRNHSAFVVTAPKGAAISGYVPFGDYAGRSIFISPHVAERNF
jgi:hypothetical protein